ncbi:MT-A70 family methyltransferase [Rhizobium rhizogenes]|jgi:N6-adenosine-specific RNA methylase IME4/ParB-like chromosome segregation protein Spo0J|uniref:MT-A70 family methyltransferase n=1 Tax=Rhizobium rhizogenes TaxID=359 RepID=UPI0024BE2E2F|nr:MT-A70 family methyltransferase [Rhizobium rhizogenes]MDJ1632693.1 MT-A70 family methyltransferase [Rhizobium rhizogenes]
MNAVFTAQQRVQTIMDAALRDGKVRSADHNERRTCIKLNVKGMLRRDSKDADLWYPTERAKKKLPSPQAIAAEQFVPAGARVAIWRDIDTIDIGYRLRGADQAKVDALKPSFQEIGQKTPITVFGKLDDARVALSAGLHRLQTATQLGWKQVLCFHEEGDDLDRELWEIDENLCRAELTAADRALFVFRRKEIYLLKHPETAQHVAGGKARHSASAKSAFAVATAEATGQAVRTVQLDAERGAKISDMALHLVRGTRLNSGSFLDRLKQIPQDRQVLYVEAALDEERRKAADVKENRTKKMQHSRMIRTSLINAIAESGTLVVGEMPRAAFAVGYCDVPWQQEAWSDETGQDKGLRYPSMSVDELMALCAGERSPFTRDAVLYFWATTNRLHHAMKIIEAWGFDYVSAITWDKVNIGMGRWVRDRTEHLLICKRGNFPGIDLYTAKPESLYSEAKTEHSRKPVWFAEEIERLYPDMRKLELFQRRESLRTGDIRLNGKWEFWGNQAGAPEGEAA